MKSITLVLLALVTALVVAVGGGQVAKADNNGAAIYKGFGCWLADGSGNFVFTDVKTHSVQITNGNAVTICKASPVANTTGKAVHWDASNTGGGTCYVVSDGVGVYTTDWDETVSASGEATLRCHLNGSS
jgi:hypothetical protein